MDLKELQKMIDEEPAPAAPETVEEVKRMEQTETTEPTRPETPPEDPKPAAPATITLTQFCGVLTSIYCGISDAVYKKIKDCKTAPAWDLATKEALNDAAYTFLSYHDIPLTPIWQLVITLGMIEVTRYTLLKPE